MGARGVDSHIVSNKNDFKAAVALLKDMESGKEYYFAVGKHAAIVRIGDQGKAEYLELQSPRPEENGWHRLTRGSLKERFACQKSHTFRGIKHAVLSYSAEVMSLGNSEGYSDLMEYINTAKHSGQKGADGEIK